MDAVQGIELLLLFLMQMRARPWKSCLLLQRIDMQFFHSKIHTSSEAMLIPSHVIIQAMHHSAAFGAAFFPAPFRLKPAVCFHPCARGSASCALATPTSLRIWAMSAGSPSNLSSGLTPQAVHNILQFVQHFPGVPLRRRQEITIRKQNKQTKTGNQSMSVTQMRTSESRRPARTCCGLKSPPLVVKQVILSGSVR